MSVINKISSSGTVYDINDFRLATVDFVQYDTSQSITETQKTTAATNIGIKNISFTIPANTVSGASISVAGVKANYACTPWLNPVFSGTTATDDAILDAYTDMRAIYLTTAADSITIVFSGVSPTVDVPCTLTVWG